MTLEVIFKPAEYAALANRDLSQTGCVVFDIFRATTTIITALANGASAIIPVSEIPDALAIRNERPEVLLAGERRGERISAQLTGSIDFDLGNSPREFTAGRIRGKTIVISTTNGSRALRACAHSQKILIGSFLNLSATARQMISMPASNWLLVCSGTGDEAAYEDILGAGALIELLLPHLLLAELPDSARMALQLYQIHSANLLHAVPFSSNGRHLASQPHLRDDIAFCLQRDVYPLVAELKNDSITSV